MANVITYGTFDLFHVGHLRQLQRARSVVRKELLYHVGSAPIVFESAALRAKYNEEVEKLNTQFSHSNSKLQLTIGGRLGQYKYFDMDKSIQAALELKLED